VRSGDALHLVERYTPPDREHLNYEVAAEDPKTFSRVWRMSMVLCGHTAPNFQVLEYDCHAMTPSSTN